MRTTTTPIALSAAAAVLLAGCATTPIEVSGKDVAGGATAPRPRNPALPLVVVGPIEDRRGFIGGQDVPASGGSEPAGADGALRGTTAGSVGGRAVSTTGFPEEVRARIMSLSSPSFSVLGEEEAGTAPAALVLHPRLIKAYMSQVNVTMTAVVIIEIESVAADGAILTRRYRGQHSKMNWASGRGEVMESMRRALAACLEQIQADLPSRIMEP